MTTPDEFRALADRAEAGNGTAPELNVMIWALLNGRTVISRNYDPYGPVGWLCRKNKPPHDTCVKDGVSSVPQYLTSLDAITTLIDEELPEWDYRSGKTSTGAWAEVDNGASNLLTGTFVDVSGRASTECRARLAAILRALANVKEG